MPGGEKWDLVNQTFSRDLAHPSRSSWVCLSLGHDSCLQDKLCIAPLISSSVHTFSGPLNLEGPGIDQAEEEQLFLFDFEEICFEGAAFCHGAPGPSPPQSRTSASLAQRRISRRPSGTPGGCQQAWGVAAVKRWREHFINKRFPSPSQQWHYGRKQNKKWHRAEITPRTLSNPLVGFPLLFQAGKPGKENTPQPQSPRSLSLASIFRTLHP